MLKWIFRNLHNEWLCMYVWMWEDVTYVSCRLVRSYLVVLYDISINIKCELKTSNTNILLEPTSASMHPTSTSNSNNAQNWCDFPYIWWSFLVMFAQIWYCRCWNDPKRLTSHKTNTGFICAHMFMYINIYQQMWPTSTCISMIYT